MYNADKFFTGQYREFALYNRALSASGALPLSGDNTAQGHPNIPAKQ
ncbi:LamG domain-containing protein [Cystobacter fuscus]|nr:LamG domain-containing protein [Cystobacter fuscus]